MLPGWIAEHLDTIKHILSCLRPRPLDLSADPFALEQVEETLCDSVVVAVATSAHGELEIVALHESGQSHADELRALVRVHRRRSSAPGVASQSVGLAELHRSPDGNCRRIDALPVTRLSWPRAAFRKVPGGQSYSEWLHSGCIRR